MVEYALIFDDLKKQSTPSHQFSLSIVEFITAQHLLHLAHCLENTDHNIRASNSDARRALCETLPAKINSG